MNGRPGIRGNRVTVEVGGYQWRVLGHQGPVRWIPHLAELLGPLPLDIPADDRLARRITAALIERMDGVKIGRVTADLILTP